MTFPVPPNPLEELSRVAREIGAMDERFRIGVLIGSLPLAECYCDSTDLAFMNKHDPTCLREAEFHFRNRVREAVFQEVTTPSAIAESDVSLPPADGARLRRLPEAAAAALNGDGDIEHRVAG